MKHIFNKVSFIVVIIVAMVLSTIATCNTSIYVTNASTIPDYVNDILTSDDISVVGFQMKTIDTEEYGISFRTVCKAPKVGSNIYVGGKTYTVKSLGTVYVLDPNQSGNNSNNVYPKNYTVLNPTPISNGNYIGAIDSFATRGYLATSKGDAVHWDPSDTANTYYVRTLTHMEDLVTNTIYARAFVVANDSAGNEVLIYGTYRSYISIAQLASDVYNKASASTFAGHNYLFNDILNNTDIVPRTNPYYQTEEVEYGWDNGTFLPID